MWAIFTRDFWLPKEAATPPNALAADFSSYSMSIEPLNDELLEAYGSAALVGLADILNAYPALYRNEAFALALAQGIPSTWEVIELGYAQEIIPAEAYCRFAEYRFAEPDELQEAIRQR